jgi:hypothetical protein
VGHIEAKSILEEIHEGVCGSHQGAKTIAFRAFRAGFYWPTVKTDASELVKRCEKCQFFGKVSRIPAQPMKSIFCPWPFDVWGIDLVGPFDKGKGQVDMLVVAIDYFTKWVEAKPLHKTTSTHIIDFVKSHIFCRFGKPSAIISDNGRQFASKMFHTWCSENQVYNNFASVGHPQSNGQVEVTNRILLDGIKKKLRPRKGKWPEYVDEVLWAYRTTPRSSTNRSPYELAFGMEAVTPVENKGQSPRVMFYQHDHNKIGKEFALDSIEEVRADARIKMTEYKRKMRQAFDRRVAPRQFQPGDLVLRRVEVHNKPIHKLHPIWEGPFRVVRSYENRAYLLETLAGSSIPNSWNIANLKKFYP